MNLIIKTLQALGFWSLLDYGYNSRRSLFLIIAVAVWIVIPGVGFIVLHKPDFATVMQILIEVIILGFTIPQALIVMVHRPLLEQTFNEMQSAILEASTDPHRDVQTVLRQLEKFSKWIFKGYVGSEMIVASSYVLSIPATILAQYITTGVLPPLRAVYEADYLIFDYRFNLWSWLATVIVSFVLSIHLVVFLIASHCFFWSLLRNISGLFKIVNMKVARLDEFSDKRLRYEEFVEIVQLQETAYKSARALEKVLSVLMLIIYGMCLIEIYMTMTTVSLASEDRILMLKVGLVLVYSFSHIFVYSELGTELISASMSTAEAIYATRWYQQSVSDQRDLLFALTRSQQMVVLTTGKFFHVNRITFGMTLRTAVSFFTVLRQVYGSQ